MGSWCCRRPRSSLPGGARRPNPDPMLLPSWLNWRTTDRPDPRHPNVIICRGQSGVVDVCLPGKHDAVSCIDRHVQCFIPAGTDAGEIHVTNGVPDRAEVYGAWGFSFSGRAPLLQQAPCLDPVFRRRQGNRHEPNSGVLATQKVRYRSTPASSALSMLCMPLGRMMYWMSGMIVSQVVTLNE